jgi:hypothetical protein
MSVCVCVWRGAESALLKDIPCMCAHANTAAEPTPRAIILYKEQEAPIFIRTRDAKRHPPPPPPVELFIIAF